MNATRKTSNYRRYGRNIMTGALAAVAMVTLDASQAQAVDGKLYPASMCVRFGGSAPRLDSSRLFNPGTTVMRLDCPVVHDFIEESIQDGYVDVIDQNNGFIDQNHGPTDIQVCAFLFSVSQAFSSAPTIRFSERKCSTSASSVSQRLSFGGLAADPNAHYFYSVSIPPTSFNGAQSAIISYKVDENE
jgi:hypothetical protein